MQHPRLPLLVTSAALVLAAMSFAACRATEDPRPGIARAVATAPEPVPPPFDAGVVPDAAGLPVGPLVCGAAPSSEVPFTKAALLGAAVDCAAFQACTLENSVHVLKSAVDRDVAERTNETRALAQLAYRRAFEAWSLMTTFEFGPVADKANDKYHGRGLRSFVHSWPDTSRCQVETQVALKGYKGSFDLVFPSGRGLFAIEYMLFFPGSDTACAATSTAGTAWAGLDADTRSAAKRDYLAAVVGDTLVHTQEIRKAYGADGEDYKAKLLRHEGYGSEQEALNVVAWSMLYPEIEIKDLKLASYAGVQPTPPNPETPFAQVDIEAIRTNLRGFRALFAGCGPNGAGIGFDDWLVASGNGALAADILDKLAGIEAAAAAFPAFSQATPQQFADLYTKLRLLTTLLKSNLFGSASPLNLKLPASAASDTD